MSSMSLTQACQIHIDQNLGRFSDSLLETVAEKVDIKHWNEFDDDDAPEPEQIFWRQHLNVLTNELSVRQD